MFDDPGVILSLTNLMELMLLISDNSATDLTLRAAGGPDALVYPSDEVCEKSAQLFENALPVATRDWAGHLRRLDALDPSYKS